MPLLHTTYSTYFILHTTYYIFRAAWHFALIESVVERTSDWFASAQCDVYGVMPGAAQALRRRCTGARTARFENYAPPRGSAPQSALVPLGL